MNFRYNTATEVADKLVWLIEQTQAHINDGDLTYKRSFMFAAVEFTPMGAFSHSLYCHGLGTSRRLARLSNQTKR